MTALKTNHKSIILLLTIYVSLVACTKTDNPVIVLWYGDEQTFGIPGNTQKFINILGNISSETPISETTYSLNDGSVMPFMLGTDLHRLAKSGDFNIEFDRTLLHPGVNTLQIFATDSAGNEASSKVNIHYTDGRIWPLPYSINWDTVSNIQNVVQVLDGKWEINENGIHIMEPYYDRTLAIGDSSWKNYEVTAEVTFINYTKPYKGAPNYNVTHAALASHWPGFDPDEFSPYRKWYPLGATCEFRLSHNLDSCGFRILGGGKLKNDKALVYHKITLGEKYLMKSSTQTIGNDSTIFRAKLWLDGTDEPAGWDISFLKTPTEIDAGCALIISHHSDVIFGKIEAVPLPEPEPGECNIE